MKRKKPMFFKGSLDSPGMYRSRDAIPCVYMCIFYFMLYACLYLYAYIVLWRNAPKFCAAIEGIIISTRKEAKTILRVDIIRTLVDDSLLVVEWCEGVPVSAGRVRFEQAFHTSK